VLGRRAVIVPGTIALTLSCLVIGICGSVPVTNRAAQWVIVIAQFFWYHALKIELTQDYV
jgi:hypothetical protein